MSFSIDRERTRINQIISKFSSNYTSPISLAKQSLNKMTRHRKVYSYESDSIKDQEINMRSLKLLSEQSLNRITQEKLENNENSTPYNHSSQQVFTFQTLREAIAANPDLIYKKTQNNSTTDKNSKVLKVKSKKREEEKVIKYLPSLKKIHQGKNDEFLNIVSHRIMGRFYSNNEGNSKFSKMSELDFKDYSESQAQKELRAFDRKMKGFMPGVIQKMRKGFVHDSLKKNSKILHVVLPKYRKNSYFNESKQQNKNFSDEDASVKGWDKMTPMDLLDPVS
jgi:hypothetical protein